MTFNDSQLRAIRHVSGPMLVLAGPGSGKTSVIISRIKELISAHHIPADNILAVTFSRASSEEMKNRFEASFRGRNDVMPVFGTFHSIFLRILKQYSSSPFKLISEQEQYTFIRSELEAMTPANDSINETVRKIRSDISRIKSSSVINHEDQSGEVSGNGMSKIIFVKYTAYLKEHGLIDFDDIIIRCLALLKASPMALGEYRQLYRYILIDEFQDISPLQYETISLLAGNECNIFAVGDDDQSIYSFRGAAPYMLMKFLRDHPGMPCVTLNISYRCHPVILGAARKLISHNKERIDKEQHALPRNGTGSVVLLKEFPGRTEEFRYITDCLNRILYAGGETCAVLFRTNADYSLLTVMLQQAGLPYAVKDREQNIADHFIAKDIMAYLQAGYIIYEFTKPGMATSMPDAYTDKLKTCLLRIINRPVRYISRDSISSCGSDIIQGISDFYAHNNRMQQVVQKLFSDLRKIGALSPSAAISYIRNAIGYEGWLNEQDNNSRQDTIALLSVLDTIQEYAGIHRSIKSFLDAGIGSQAEGSSGRKAAKNQIQIMTMHASKGLEFDHVFLPDVNKDVMPAKRSVQDGLLEEERRLFYVAMTRAKSRLYISWAARLHNSEAYRSVFIDDIIL